MLHTIRNGDDTYRWRDPEDISKEMGQLRRHICAAQECYAALETARKSLVNYPDDEETKNLLQMLMGEAQDRLGHIEEACRELSLLQEEMRETVCLMLRM